MRTRGPLSQLLLLEPSERTPVVLSTLYHFCLLAGYYIIRPMRDEISGSDAHPRDVIDDLWASAFFAMLVLVPAYSFLVSRLSRKRFIPIANRFFMGCLLLFCGLFLLRDQPDSPIPTNTMIFIERVFYVWASVYNLFVITVFWGFMVDLYRDEQGRRTFGIIAIGGTLGAVLGASMTKFLAEYIEPAYLLLGSVTFLEIATQLAKALHRRSPTMTTEDSNTQADEADEPLRGSMWSGFVATVRNPYLGGIALYILLMTLSSTFIYFAKGDIVRAHFGADRDARIEFYATVDLLTNIFTVLMQLFVTGRIMSRFGVAITLAALPVICMFGFGGLWASQTLAVIVALDVGQRIARYAFSRPSREVLFTLVSREQKYKAKSFIDTAVYRGGDVVNAMLYTRLAGEGEDESAAQPSAAAVGFCAIWFGLALILARAEARRAKQE